MENFFLKALTILGISFVIPFVLNIFTIRFSKSLNIISIVDFRRKKKNHVPLMGGLPIYISIVAVTLLFRLESFYPLIISAIPLIAVGLWDDVKELSAKFKSLGHLLAITLWFFLIGTDSLLLDKIGLPLYLSIPLTAFWVMGIINALNMIDGMDSEAISFSLTATMSYIAVIGFTQSSLPLFTIIGAGLGFLIYNLPPAKLYLGDSGSTFLGFALATFGASLPLEMVQPSFVLIPLFILAFPEVDAIAAIVRRLQQSTSISQGDQDHIHHKLIKLGFSLPQIIAVIIFVTLYCGLTAVLISKSQTTINTIGISSLAIFGLMALLSSILLLEFKQAQQVSNYSQTLIKQSIKPTKSVMIDSQKFRLTAFDLLPYYKELQQSGIVSVQAFISEFATFVDNNYKDHQVSLAGSYSIIIVEKPEEVLRSSEEITAHFFELLDKHDIKKNKVGLPWGMSLFSGGPNGHKVLEKFNIPHFNDIITDIRKAS